MHNRKLFKMVLNLSLNQQSGIRMNNSYHAGKINLSSFSKGFIKDIMYKNCIKTSSALTYDISKTENELTILLEKKKYDEVKQKID